MRHDSHSDGKIPITVLVVTKNEEERIGRCLESVRDFAEVIVIDSYSKDRTIEIAERHNAKVVLFEWDKLYPKKRQWCLNTQSISYDWVFMLDADEIATTAFVEEIKQMTKNSLPFSGFFVRGQYVWKGKPLKHGLMNNKLALFNRSMVEYPVVDDLNIDGMGEIEGHYQPVYKNGQNTNNIGQINNPILHYAYDNEKEWQARHERYARWEAEMIRREAFPADPDSNRELLKRLTRRSKLRPFLMFFYSYIVKLGFLDGIAGLEFALSRKQYCDMVLRELKDTGL